jgi:ABC-type dipeptide/oligopeptide/nickel transport system ATPase component
LDNVMTNNAQDQTIHAQIAGIRGDAQTDDIERLLRQIAQEDPLQQNRLCDLISEATGIGKAVLNRQLRIYIKAIKAEKQHNDLSLKADAASNAYDGFSKQIIVPINGDGTHKKESELVLIRASDGSYSYVSEFWNAQKRISAPAERQLSQALKAEGTKSGLELIIGGESEAALSPTLNQLKKDVELALEQGEVGIPCRVTFGPYLDKEQGKLHTVTNLDEGILVLNQRHSVDIAPEPMEDPTIIEDSKAIFGSNVDIIIGHVIASVTNEDPFGKHIMCIIGSSGAGKSTVARWIAHLIGDLSPTVVSGSSLEGSWPIVFGCRSPIFDNLDKYPLTPQALDILASALTQDVTNVPARYTPAGLSAALGYPILTSIHESTIDHYPALKSRAVIIRQSTSIEIMELNKSGAYKPILARLVRHVWWLIERYIIDLKDGKVPVCPGGIRNTIARPYWWYLTTVSKLTPEQAEIECELLKVSEESEDPDEQNAFVAQFDRAMNAEFGLSGQDQMTFRATDVGESMRRHCLQEDLDVIFVGKDSKFTTHKQIGKAVRRLVENHRTQNRIKKWIILDRFDKKIHSTVFNISRLASETSEKSHKISMLRQDSPASAGKASEASENGPSFGLGVEINNFSQPPPENFTPSHTRGSPNLTRFTRQAPEPAPEAANFGEASGEIFRSRSFHSPTDASHELNDTSDDLSDADRAKIRQKEHRKQWEDM